MYYFEKVSVRRVRCVRPRHSAEVNETGAGRAAGMRAGGAETRGGHPHTHRGGWRARGEASEGVERPRRSRRPSPLSALRTEWKLQTVLWFVRCESMFEFMIDFFISKVCFEFAIEIISVWKLIVQKFWKYCVLFRITFYRVLMNFFRKYLHLHVAIDIIVMKFYKGFLSFFVYKSSFEYIIQIIPRGDVCT